MLASNIYDFTLSEEQGFNKPISLEDGWEWSMKEHLRKSFLYKNSQFTEKNDDRKLRPFTNIVRPILNVHYRTEGFDVKDIEIYVNEAKNYYKSFLIKKFHENWALDNEIDTFIDEVVESYVDYGGTLVKNVKGVRPEVVQLQSLAFCDQTDILSGPFAVKHYFSPDQLRDMASVGWGEESKGATINIEDLITLAEFNKRQDIERGQVTTPGKYVEIYEIHGQFPDDWLKGRETTEGKHTSQVHIVGFYKDNAGMKQGVTLFSAREPKLPFKFLARDKVFGRALGFGAIEELFEDQVWTNYSDIQIMEMLELASKTFYKTTDPAFKTRNNVTNQENGAIFTLAEGKDINQVDTSPRNLVAFTTVKEERNTHAQIIGAAGESLQGQNPSSGTPFKLQELVTMEAKSLHVFRQGKIAVFIDEIYRDWIIPYMGKEITKDQSFLAELSAEEFQKVVESVVDNRAQKWAIYRILDGEPVSQEEIDAKKLEIQTQMAKRGSKMFIEWLKGEFGDDPLAVKTNIAGKQKNLALLTDKFVNLIRQFIATPQLRQDSELTKMLNTLLEGSGISPVLYGGASAMPQQQIQQGNPQTQPLQDFAQANKQMQTA